MSAPQSSTFPNSNVSEEEFKKRITGSGTKDDPYKYTDSFGIVYKWNEASKLWESEVLYISHKPLMILRRTMNLYSLNNNKHMKVTNRYGINLIEAYVLNSNKIIRNERRKKR